eukprot:1221349-Ditylum_brightwellii.AAC.1
MQDDTATINPPSLPNSKRLTPDPSCDELSPSKNNIKALGCAIQVNPRQNTPKMKTSALERYTSTPSQCFDAR